MLLYDVVSFPKYIDGRTWLDLLNKGVVLFDSMNGIIPLKLDNDSIHLIDINSMNHDDLKYIADLAAEIIKEKDESKEREQKIFNENNQKLIKYLKSINDEKI